MNLTRMHMRLLRRIFRFSLSPSLSLERCWISIVFSRCLMKSIPLNTLASQTHVTIYIETQPRADERARAGLMFHVVGNILQGMTYQKRDTKDPLLSASYVAHTKKKIGTTAAKDLNRFETECCNAVAPRGFQVTLSGKRKDLSKPLYRCNNWLDDVISLAFQKGIFEP